MTHPFLHGMPAEQVERIEACGTPVKFEQNTFLLREGVPARSTYLLLAGQVVLELYVPGRGAITVETLREGDVIGWSWLMAPYRWHFDARCVTPVEAVMLDGDTLRSACEASPELGYQLLQRYLAVVADRIERMRLQLADVFRSHP